MKNTLQNGAVATAIIVIVAIVGAALVILSALDAVKDPQLRLGFNDYLTAISVGAGLLGIGRGLAARKTR